MKKLASILIVGLIALAACGSEAALGEECDEDGVQDGECAAGLVCGKGTDAALTCLKQCTAQADCPANAECNGTAGSMKGCRIKK